MKSLFVLITNLFFLIVLNPLFSQHFSYTWGPTGTKVDVSITYSLDSSTTFVLRQETSTHSYSVIDSEQSIVFIGDNIEFGEDKVTLPLNNKLYIILPFDPAVSATTRINYSLDSLDSVSIMLGSHEILGLQATSPDTGDFYWCSCNMSTETPGGCVATLETAQNGRKFSRCINDANCSNCVGWMGPLSTIIEQGGGFIIEIKDSYAQNIQIGN